MDVEVIITILLMMVIGAIIGGVTNSLAIKMLFRPYKALYIGKRRVPFTPGLIPKRREELAKQLGRMVVQHLLTPESIKRKFDDVRFKKDIVQWVQVETRKLLSNQQTLNDIATKYNITNLEEKISMRFESYIEERYEGILTKVRNKMLVSVIPKDLMDKLEEKIPELGQYILGKGISFFESEEGNRRLRLMIDDFLATRGTLGNMVQMFLGNESLVNKVQPEVIKFLKNPGTLELINKLIEEEWNKVKEWKVERLEEGIGREKILSFLKTKVKEELPINKWLSTSIDQLTEPFQEQIISTFIPRLVETTGDFVASRIEEMMDKLHLAEIVRQQVETFSVDRLEELILSISRKEFKMITYLGALLGGLIGIMQGLLVFLIR